jgi:hypothetical protein
LTCTPILKQSSEGAAVGSEIVSKSLFQVIQDNQLNYNLSYNKQACSTLIGYLKKPDYLDIFSQDMISAKVLFLLSVRSDILGA